MLAPVDKHMREPTNRSDGFFVLLKHPHFIADTGLPQMPYPQTTINDARVRQRLEESALRLRDHANHLTLFEIQQLVLNQKLVHDTINVAKVHRIINMTIDIIIDPPGADLLPICVIAT